MSEKHGFQPEIARRVTTCLLEVDGEHEVKDMTALVDVAVAHWSEYWSLYDMMKTSGSAVIKHHEET